MDLYNALVSRCVAAPNSTLIIDADEDISSVEFLQLVEYLSELLVTSGVKKSSVVGISINDTAIHLAILFSIAKIGAAGFPFSSNNTNKDLLEEICFMLDLKIVVFDSEHFLLNLQSKKIQLNSKQVRNKSKNNSLIYKTLESDLDKQNLFFVYKTSSGTTGKPKVITESYYGICKSIAREIDSFGYSETTKFMTPVSLSLDGPRRRYLACILSGGVAVTPPKIRNGKTLLESIALMGLTHFSCVASHAAQIISLDEFKHFDIPRLQCFRVSAGPISKWLRDSILKKFSQSLYISFGCTEIGPITVAEPNLVAKDSETVGVPMNGVSVEIVDKNKRVLRKGQCGLIRVCVEGMPSDYFYKDQTTSSYFQDGWFYTGDVGRITDSGLQHLGRVDDMIVYDGINIPPRIIENKMFEHPAVKECVAFSLRHPIVYDVPACAVVLNSDTPVSETILIDHGSSLGPSAPKRVAILEIIPKTDNGKLVKGEFLRLVSSYFEKYKI